MLRKSLNRVFCIMRIFCLIAISGAICYLVGCDNTQKSEEPVKIYRTTEPERNGTSETTSPLSSVNGRTSNGSTHQEGAKTIDTLMASESISTSSEDALSDNTDPSTTSGDFAQQNSESDMSQQSDEELEKETKKQKIAEVQAKLRRMKGSLREVQNSLENFEERHNSRLYALVKKLNSLSAAEQRIYFEEYRGQAPAAKEFIRTTFFEKAKSEAASLGYSEQAEELLNQIEQTVLEKTDEEMVDEHIKELLQWV
jgi:uncharacterized protein YfkK (UPF0435 family)